MKLNDEELKKLSESLKAAFPPETEQLELVVKKADIGIDFAGYKGQYEDPIGTLLQDTASQCRLMDLLKAAIIAAPDSPELLKFAEMVKQYFDLVPRFQASTENQKSYGDVERILFKNVGFQNVRGWVKKLNWLTGTVCRIEPQPERQGIGGYGTGFLVGPNVILTNDHVASGVDGKSGFWGRSDRAAEVRIRFDYEYTAKGKRTVGKEYKLASDYQILRSPANELDYALLKLDRSPSKDVVRKKLRWFVVPVPHTFESSEPLLIAQHPQALPMKMAFGSLTPENQWPKDRITYSVNTGPGSSGSPCLTQDLLVGAVHRWGSDFTNCGIPISALHSQWSKPENSTRLIAVGLGHLVDGKETAGEAVLPDTGKRRLERKSSLVPLRNYLFLSRTRVKMLSAQLPPVKRHQAKGKNDNYTMLDLVIGRLDQEGVIGTCDHPSSYFRGTLSMCFHDVTFVGTVGRMVLFSGLTEKGTIVGLVGSTAHIIGAPVLQPESVYYACPVFWKKIMESLTPPSQDIVDNEILDLDRIFKNQAFDPRKQQKVEFVARTILREEKYLIGTPLYVATAN